MDDIIIYGSGGMAIEAAWVIDDINSVNPRWNIIGFIDDFKDENCEPVFGHPILGPGEILSRYSNPNVLLAISNPDSKKTVEEKISVYRPCYPVIIHPLAKIGPGVIIGEGSLIGIDCIISVGVKIGRHVFLNSRTVIGHESNVGDYTSCLVNCLISGNVEIDEGCLLGSGCVIMEKVHIKKGARAGMGSVVCYDVEEGSVIMSRPSKSMKFQ